MGAAVGGMLYASTRGRGMSADALSVAREHFGSYRLVERLAVGSVGEVLHATDGQGRAVALKRLLPSAAGDQGVVAAFEAETDLAGALDHDGIARLVDRGRVSGVAFAAYELVRGRDLRTVLERLSRAKRRMPADVAAWLAARIADALSHVHERRDGAGRSLDIVHRDVAPANVVVGFDGSVKLVDFGIARAANRPAQTARNEVRGTLRYVSPEQVAQEVLDPRSDLFSLGLVLWELLVGRPALDGPLDQVLGQLATGTVPAPRDVEPSVPAAIDAVVRKVLAKKREERYDSASKFSDALTASAASASAAAASPSAPGHDSGPADEPHHGPGHRARLARLMHELFPGEVSQEYQMADDKGSSDLDVFEGLAKKSARPSQISGGGFGSGPASGPVSSGPGGPPPLSSPSGASTQRATPPPPPPPGSLRGPQQGKTTLLGVPVPALPAGDGSAAPPPPPPSKRQPSSPGMAATGPVSTPLPLPPPPASRKNTLIGATSPAPLGPPPSTASTPPALPPPPGSAAASPAALPPPPPSAVAPPVALPPPPQAEGPAPGVEMDWDDDEESTHVFEKRKHAMANGATPKPAAGVPASTKVGAAATLISASGGTARASVPAPAPTVPSSTASPMAPPAGPSPAPLTSSVPPPPPVPARPADVAPVARRPSEMDTVVRPRPGDGAGKAGVVLGGLALVAVGGLAAFLLWPKTGQLKIDLKSRDGQAIPRAEIFVDGQKRCDTAPCVVADLSTGSKSIRVIPPSGAFVDQTATVSAGKEELVFITLEGGGATPATPAGDAVAAKGTGFKVAGGQPGVKVYVDGVDKGAPPVSLTDLTPGKHTIKLDGGDRYQPQEQTIDVAAGEVKDLGETKLKVVKGLVTLDLKTEGADVLLSGTVDGKKVEKKLPASIWKSPPVRLPIDLKKEVWTLVATKKGSPDFRRELDFADGNPEPTIVIELGAEAPAPVAAAPTGAAPTGAAPTGAAPTGPAGTPPAPSGKPADGKDPGKQAATGQGTLNINSIPVSKVLLDGRPIGSTPKAGVSVSPGSHTVTFVKDGERKSVTVTVKAGETKVAAVKF